MYAVQVFGPGATQATVYSAVAKPLVEFVCSGLNGAIFAYGQQRSGKTHTLYGTLGIASDEGACVCVCVCQECVQRDFLVRFLAVRALCRRTTFTVRCSVLVQGSSRGLLKAFGVRCSAKVSLTSL